MDILNINSKNIKCFKLSKNGNLIRASLKKLLFEDNDSVVLVEISLFGISNVYSLIDFSKITDFSINQFKNFNLRDILSIGKISEDCPVIDGINLLSKEIDLSLLSKIEWLVLYQLSNIINGMNSIIPNSYSDSTEYYLNFGDSIDYSNLIDLSSLHFSCDNYTGYKYILKFDDSYEFSNSIYSQAFDGVYVYIPEFKSYQYISKKKYENLFSAKSIEISYTKHNYFWEPAEYETFYCESLLDILKYSIFIPIDIYFKKIFKECDPRYESLQIKVEKRNYSTSVLLSYDEIGLNKEYSKTNVNSVMDSFNFLKLINNVISLKPY